MTRILTFAVLVLFCSCKNNLRNKCKEQIDDDYAHFDSMTVRATLGGFTFIKYVDNYKITRNHIYQDTAYRSKGLYNYKLPDSLLRYSTALLDSVPTEMLVTELSTSSPMADVGHNDIIAYKSGQEYTWKLANNSAAETPACIRQFVIRLHKALNHLRIIPPDTL